MRSILTWLLVLGIIAGGMLRFSPYYPAYAEFCSLDTDCVEQHEHSCSLPQKKSGLCCASDAHSTAQADTASSAEHHHHIHICCGAAPMIAEAILSTRVIAVSSTRAPIHIEDQAKPETPVFKLDKPPLI